MAKASLKKRVKALEKRVKLLEANSNSGITVSLVPSQEEATS